MKNNESLKKKLQENQKQNKSSNYMKKIAKKSTPVNDAIAVDTLTSALKLINKIRDYSEMFGYNNIGSITDLEKDIRKGVKGRGKNKIYSENGMSGILNIGTSGNNYKHTQEDSILILSHPENKDFKLALVADGIGGRRKGDISSFIAILTTFNWFRNLPKSFYKNDEIEIKYDNGRTYSVTFNDMIKQHLIDINNMIVKKLGVLPGTTFSAAITRNKNGKDKVTSISIGDSKILKISKNGEVNQLSKDDNLLSEGIKNGSLYLEDSNPDKVYTSNRKYAYVDLDIQYKPREYAKRTHTLDEKDIKFYLKNNVITECLGCGRTEELLRKKLDKNTRDFISEWDFNKGDKLLLCSDGVSDNFSNPEIAGFVYTFRNSTECLRQIVNGIYDIENKKIKKGKNNTPKHLKNNNNFTDTLKGSEDNISAIIIDNEGEER